MSAEANQPLQPGPPGAVAPNAAVQHPLANYQFSSEELRVLRECDMESFVQRSLPLGTTFGLGAYMAVKNGLIKGSVRFGAGPKTAIAVVLGYFIGKFSYQRRCAEKIMQLPDSRLAEMLRMRNRGCRAETFSSDQGYGTGLSLSPFASASDRYSDVASRSSPLNLDTDRPANQGLDDTFRPNVDGPITKFDDNLPLEPPKQQTTYDELRRRNREDYAKKQNNPYYRPVEAHEQPPPVIRAPTGYVPDPDAESPAARKQRNKYGDDWSA